MCVNEGVGVVARGPAGLVPCRVRTLHSCYVYTSMSRATLSSKDTNEIRSKAQGGYRQHAMALFR